MGFAMMGSKNPQGEQRFITDFGEELPLTDESGQQVMLLPRYGVWGDMGRGKPEVIETHNDLAMMQADHGVPNERVVLLKRRQEDHT